MELCIRTKGEKKDFYMMKISKIKKLCVVTGSRAEYGLLKIFIFN